MQPSQRSSFVKQLVGSFLVALGGGLACSAATLPIFINDAPLTSPPAIAPRIDARIWVNQSLFDITTELFPIPLPFESLNTLYFTNAPGAAGIMNGDPGFRFFQNVNGQKFWMAAWENQGTITTDHSVVFSGSDGVSLDSSASILQVEATNIVSTGPLLSSGTHGLVRLEGKTIDVSYGGIRAGSGSVGGNLVSSSFNLYGTNGYANDVGVTDIYWGGGTNNTLDGSGAPMFVGGSGGGFNLTLPVPSSPSHQYLEWIGQGITRQGVTSVPQGSYFTGRTSSSGQSSFPSGYAAAANRRVVSPTNSIVQVVFYPIRSDDPSITTDVRFFPSGNLPAIAVVGFHASSFDIASQQTIDDSVYLIDGLGRSTNFYFSPNLDGHSQRPNSYKFTRLTPVEYRGGAAGNIAFANDLLVSPSYLQPTVTNFYSAYAVDLGLASSSASGTIAYDPTNLPGRVEIFGDNVNLDQTRIRAESSVVIRGKNMSSNRLAQVDAPFVVFDAGSTQPVMVISNLAPASVQRLHGTVRAWSASWTNSERTFVNGAAATNNIFFHVLIVDNSLATSVAVTVNEFSARGSNIVIADGLRLGKSFLVSGDSLYVSGGLSLPSGLNLKSNTLVNLRNFTNDGIIDIVGTENLGADRPTPYSNYVNRGTNSAASHFIRASNFDNTGIILANNGIISVDALNASMQGKVQNEFTILQTNRSFTANGIVTTVTPTVVVVDNAPRLRATDIQIFARDLSISNSIIEGGRLGLSITNRLVDGGTNAISNWSVTAGFNVSRKPAFSDLLGTHLHSTAAPFTQASHYWSGSDLGATPAGFSNNLALGKLTLDAASGSALRFYASGTSNALYVDYLELANAATNVNALLSIAPNFTIYFANASIPATKLDGAVGGRLRWVPDYTGPLSSTNLVYFFTNGLSVTSNTYTFNTALVTSRDLDSNLNGIVNAFDPMPIYVSQNAQLAVSFRLAAAGGGAMMPYALLSWTALAHSSNSVEFRSGAQGGKWEVLTNFLFEECYTAPVSIMDPAPGNGAVRLYRLKVDRGPFGLPCDY